MIETIIYDHPLNEVVRVCLRLEQLFQYVDYQVNDLSIIGTQTLLHTIIDILHILDRPDLKAKLAKELNLLLSSLQRFETQPQVDKTKLTTLIQQLNELSRTLIDSSGKIGYRLREVELLNNLRLQLTTPGGGCSFELPGYHYWLQQSVDVRKQTIQDWLGDFAQIRTASTLLLDLIRKNAKTEEKIAVQGFHQELLDPQLQLRMVRIGIPKQTPAYPEVSLGRHFFSVRFFFPYIEKRPIQYDQNLHFTVAYCNC
jgi:cell division protein ZapD